MATELTKPTPELDGFEAFEDAVEGDGEEQQSSNQIVHGRRIKFTNEATWVFADDEEELPKDLDLVVVDILRVTQKWTGDNDVVTTILAPGEKFPDVTKRNEDAPRNEWRMGPSGQLVGPWQNAYVLYLLAPESVDRFTFITSTIGGGIATRDLVERTKWMRKFRGTQVYPVVQLHDTYMHTRFGGRQRPHLQIQKWITLDGGRVLPPTETPALPGPATPPGSAGAAAPTPNAKTTLDQFAGDKHSSAKVVTPPTAKEVTGDEIPW